MAARPITHIPPTMASPWRRRALCVLVDGGETMAALREIDGRGAFIETAATPPLGHRVTLRHPDAGAMAARVVAHAADGVRLAFEGREAGLAFALAAIVSDMSRPGI